MNNKRRKAINKVISTMEELLAELEAIKWEEEEAKENLSPALQYSDKAERMAAALGNLENAIYSLDESIDFLQDAKKSPLKPSKSPLDALS